MYTTPRAWAINGASTNGTAVVKKREETCLGIFKSGESRNCDTMSRNNNGKKPAPDSSSSASSAPPQHQQPDFSTLSYRPQAASHINMDSLLSELKHQGSGSGDGQPSATTTGTSQSAQSTDYMHSLDATEFANQQLNFNENPLVTQQRQIYFYQPKYLHPEALKMIAENLLLEWERELRGELEREEQEEEERKRGKTTGTAAGSSGSGRGGGGAPPADAKDKVSHGRERTRTSTTSSTNSDDKRSSDSRSRRRQ